MKKKSVLPRMIAAAFPLIAALAIATPASAAGIPPHLSAPSGMMAGNTITLMGLNFPANTIVKVSVTEPLGQQVEGFQVVGADGRLSYPLMSSLPGSYQVRVSDQAGNALANATVMLAGN